MTNKPPPSPGIYSRSADSLVLTVVGLSFLAWGAWGVVALIQAASASSHGGAAGLSWMIAVAAVAAALYAGLRILQRDERGRNVGMALAIVGLVFGLVSISDGGASLLDLAVLAIAAWIVWVLRTSSPFIRR